MRDYCGNFRVFFGLGLERCDATSRGWWELKRMIPRSVNEQWKKGEYIDATYIIW